MRNQEIISQLKRLRELRPHAEYAATSRRAILAHSQEARFPFSLLFQPVYAGTFALSVLLLVALSFFFIGGRTPTYASLDADALSTELEDLIINIELQEVAYSATVQETVAVALREIGNDDLPHLNTNLIENEGDLFEFQDEGNPEIEELLDTLLF